MSQRETEYHPWPSWAHGPNGEAEIFHSEDDVPHGWRHHETVKGGKPAKAAPAAPAEPAPAGDGERDASGTVYDPARHAASKGKTNAGLWRMKVGVSRPAHESAPLQHDL